jgi:VanZ family protein
LGYLGALLWLLTTGDPIAQTKHDKLAHGAAFGVLAILAFWAFGSLLRRRLISAFLALLFASAYGAFGEWVQSLTGSRSADIQDWYADTIGAAIGFVLMLILHRPKRPAPTRATSASLKSRPSKERVRRAM